MTEYRITWQPVSAQRWECRWEPNPFPGYPDSFWVEYPAADLVGVSPALLPMLALSFADSRFHVAGPVTTADEKVMPAWQGYVEEIAREHFGKPVRVQLEVSAARPAGEVSKSGTALLFGGGTESLLVLGELLAKDTRPELLSFIGPGWTGNDPARNPTKLRSDRQVADELGLGLHHIRTNVYAVFAQLQPVLQPRLVHELFFANGITFAPALLALAAPLARREGWGTICHGNERQDHDWNFHCFTPAITSRLTAVFAPHFDYQHWLGDMDKAQVFEKLWGQYPAIGRYQYSCFANDGARWCLNCEKCFRNYVLFRIFDVPLSAVQFDEPSFLQQLDRADSPVIRELLADGYRRYTYQSLLTLAEQRGRPEEAKFLTQQIRRSSRLWRRQRIRSRISAVVPAAVRRVLKRQPRVIAKL